MSKAEFSDEETRRISAEVALDIIEEQRNSLRTENQRLREALREIRSMQSERGRAGCTYGDTEFDSLSAARGYNDCLDHVREIECSNVKSRNVKPSGGGQPDF